ncbi:MFS transporter [Kitasatospora sp. NBC_01250]|uniref:MFS transporter n=1 Tax=unclassified Kitasatospora TaxID=2633591 RepID=UPI002E1359B7|nr:MULTISPECIES: MFS transporter [unclassified Kitasatospora]WSJ65783.1 MFS transporter [Kitasatospora sp. NBC_01302]
MTPTPLTPSPRLALLVSVAGAMIVALDGTVLTVAQPSLQRTLGAGVTQVQWTSTGYLLAVAALLVLAGRLGDRYGHPRLLAVGVLGFGAASAGIVLAPDIGWVIVLRTVQGAFGALLQPATLALLRLGYPADRLAGPIAIRTSAIGLAAAAGPVLGGAIVTHLGWRAVFVLNVPVALAIAALALLLRAPGPDAPRQGAPRQGAERLDPSGALLLSGALAVLVGTLSTVPGHGWTAPPTLLGFTAAAAVAIAFVLRERRSAHPLVPPVVARSVPVTASMALLLATSAGMFGALFTVTFFLQDVRGLDPLASGLYGLPLTALMILGAPVAGAALRRHGPRRTALTGMTLVALGIATLSRLTPAGGWALGGTAFAVLGAGYAAVMVSATGTVVGEAPPGYAGVIGGLKQTAMNIGPTLGIAIAASLMSPRSPGTTTTTAPSAAGLPPALLTLAAVAALGLLPAALLPNRPATADSRRPTPEPPRTTAPDPA